MAGLTNKVAYGTIRHLTPFTHKMVIPCHYDVAFFWIRNINPADDQSFKSEVEKLGIECCIMEYGDEIEV